VLSKLASKNLSTGNGRQQGGQVVVLLAIAIVFLVGITGVAVDGGRAYVNRRTLQSAADNAADAGMRMIIQDYRDTANGRKQSYSDCQIATVVKTLAQPGAVQSAGNGLDSALTIVQYTDETGAPANAGLGNATSTPTCIGGGASTLNICDQNASTGCVAGIAHTPQFTQNTYLMRDLGVLQTTQKATATALFKLKAPTTGGIAPFAVWWQSCSDSTGDELTGDPVRGETIVTTDAGITSNGDIVNYHDNQWLKVAAGCGTGRSSKESDDFKGYFPAGNLTPGVIAPTPFPQCPGELQISDTPGMNCYQTDGGDRIGPAKAALDAATGGSDFAIMPVINSIEGHGHYDGTVLEFAVVRVRPFNATDTNVSFSATGRVWFICQPGSFVGAVGCKIPPQYLTLTSGFFK